MIAELRLALNALANDAASIDDLVQGRAMALRAQTLHPPPIGYFVTARAQRFPFRVSRTQGIEAAMQASAGSRSQAKVFGPREDGQTVMECLKTPARRRTRR